MAEVTLTKAEYERLKRQAAACRQFAIRFFETAVQDPVEEVVEDFRKTDLYTEEFLSDLEDGLRKSSYAKKHVHQATPKRP